MLVRADQRRRRQRMAVDLLRVSDHRRLLLRPQPRPRRPQWVRPDSTNHYLAARRRRSAACVFAKIGRIKAAN